MREPIFQAEYLKSTSNRYRFAWIIATSDPVLQADDVDRDLMLIATRALDKNWQRRSALRLEDFLADAATQQTHALQVLGLGVAPGSIQQTENIAAKLQRVREVSETLRATVAQYLRDQGVRATHEIHPGRSDTSKVIWFQWEAPAAIPGTFPPQIELRLELGFITQPGGHHFGLKMSLSMRLDGKDSMAAVELPEGPDESGIAERMFQLVTDTFPQLASQVSRGNSHTAGCGVD